MSIKLGLNLEFSRHHNMSFEKAVEEAANIGYQYVEPMVHLGRQLLAEGGFMHSLSLSEDPLRVKDFCSNHGVQISALSSHSQLCKPDMAVDYIRQGIRWAGEMKVPVVNTSEGTKRSWTTEAEDFTLIKYSLKIAADDALRRGVVIGLEPHHQYSASIEGMERLMSLINSPAIGLNYDTGNAFIAGQSDIYSYLEHFSDRLVHLHAKDISYRQSSKERGKVTGTPVGCACGDGVVDWKRVVEICKKVPRDIVFSVECGTLEQAQKSYLHLKSILG
ncbi:MAG: sugar phosphate isomerase/epimerase [Deltaproteobacteria bacterium]|jgi:sugar phosphate isomerase/epimerase|nr:sugar phosphate isomerase/epimerase [Deltaproteobacteria bacterium]